MPVLTGIDVLGVQRYLFASNRLRDAVAASSLVHWATASGGALDGSGGELLLASGAKALMRFANEGQARNFIARYTRRLYDEAPGLEVVVVHRSQDNRGLAAALGRLQMDLSRAKLERVPAVPQLGISVTAACRISGLPATGFDPQDTTVPLSRMVLRWRERAVREPAMDRWDAFLNDGERFAFPPKIDDMGRTRGDTSLVGIVHIDGNGVGEQITAWLRQCVQEPRPDDVVGRELRTWTTALEGAGRRSLEAVVKRVSAAIDENDRSITGAMTNLGFNLSPSERSIFVPLRPVLLGGDDLRFFCDGRIALDLAETALDAFAADIPNLGPVTACAGVALVPAHTRSTVHTSSPRRSAEAPRCVGARGTTGEAGSTGTSALLAPEKGLAICARALLRIAPWARSSSSPVGHIDSARTRANARHGAGSREPSSVQERRLSAASAGGNIVTSSRSLLLSCAKARKACGAHERHGRPRRPSRGPAVSIRRAAFLMGSVHRSWTRSSSSTFICRWARRIRHDGLSLASGHRATLGHDHFGPDLKTRRKK